MPDSLQKLFGSAPRVKVLRLFLFNTKQLFTATEVADRARISMDDTRHELALFLKIKLIRRSTRGRDLHYVLDERFPHILPLQNLLLNASVRVEDIYTRIKGCGTLKFVSVGGIFLGETEGTIDMLVVGDNIKERKLKDDVKLMESEIGKELRYAFLSTTAFFYRLNMNDRLLRDVFDYPHKILYDKLDIGLK